MTKVRAALHKQKGEEHLADLADRLTEGAWEDLAESWRLARQIEEMAAARSALRGSDVDAELMGELEQQDLPTQPSVVAADYRSIAVERSNRAKLRDQIAKFNGLDHLKQRELALRERQAEAAERGAKAATDLAAQLGQHGWLCAVPEGPEE